MEGVWTPAGPWPAALGHRAAMAVSLEKNKRQRELLEKRSMGEKRDGGRRGGLTDITSWLETLGSELKKGKQSWGSWFLRSASVDMLLRGCGPWATPCSRARPTRV